MQKDINSRIGIIGAGASGLTAAETLRSLGYNDITILEKENSAGGKCCSFEYEGRSYELGAGIVAANHKTVMDLARKEGIEFTPISSENDYFYDLETGEVTTSALEPGETFPFYWQLILKYARLSNSYKNLNQAGFLDIHPDLFLSFSDWAEKHNVPLVKKNFERFFTGFGYGYWERIPAAYVLKYYDWETLKSYFREGIYYFPDGIQSLWVKIAKHHKVVYDCSIKSVKRNSVIKVETNQKTFEFDYLIVSSPLNESLSFMDDTPNERALFSKIKHEDYQTYACIVNNFTPQTGFVPRHFKADKAGHPLFWYKRQKDSNLYTFYVLGNWKIAEDTIIENVKTCIQTLGGTLESIIDIRKWNYFPHVDSEEMRAGFYKHLEDMQGTNRTYYIGELFNFSMVEHTARYAHDRMMKWFK